MTRQSNESEFRRQVFADFNNTCFNCEETSKLVVHHIDGNQFNNSKENILLMCHGCHMRVHNRQRALQIQNTEITLEKTKELLAYKPIKKETTIEDNNKKLKRLPTVLSEEEVKKIFNVISSPRDLMLLQTIYYLGCRVNEVIQITKNDVDFKNNIVNLRAETTKRHKERRQPIPDNFFKPLKQYCDIIGDDTILFKMTKQRAWQIVKHYTKLAGITKNVHPHTFRHSYATQVYQKTNDIRYVQELLGHENLATTSIYTHLDDKTKKNKMKGVF